MAALMQPPLQYVRVVFDFSYTSRDGTNVSITSGEELRLLKKTTGEWWQVNRIGAKKPIYVPANYVEEFQKTVVEVTNARPKKPPPPTKPRRPKPPSLEETVLKDLDDILDNACDDPLEEDLTDIDNGHREEVSCKADSPASGDHITEDDAHRDDSSSGVHSMDSLDDALDKPASLDSPSVGTSHSREDLSQSAPGEPNNNKESAGHRHLPAKPCIVEEEPEYANTASLGIQPKVPQGGEKGDDLPAYANLAAIQMAIGKTRTRPDSSIHAFGNLPTDYSRSGAAPPAPMPEDTPLKVLENGWQLHQDVHTSKTYYFHPGTNESSWTAPRNAARLPPQSDYPTTKPAHIEESSSSSPPPDVPSGWSPHNTDDGKVFFINDVTAEKWYKAKDEKGRAYYFKNGTSETVWSLPQDEDPDDTDPLAQRPVIAEAAEELPNIPDDASSRISEDSQSVGSNSSLNSLPQPTLYLPPPTAPPTAHATPDPPPPGAPPSQLIPLQEMKGMLNKTKISENGKKVKKNWMSCYVVMTGSLLYFYRDMKAAQTKPTLPIGRPDQVLELQGSVIERISKDVTSKKNSLQLSFPNSAQYLLQSDSPMTISDWFTSFDANQKALARNAQLHGLRDTSTLPAGVGGVSGDARKNQVRTSGDQTVSPDDPDTRKKWEWLMFKLRKRPTYESLKDKGIIKYAVYGSHMQTITEAENLPIPSIVLKCIICVEQRGINVDGIYRVSGNLADIQKLRFLVDHNEKFNLMDPMWDIHVVTGALKLFFRELREPLFPFNMYDRFILAVQNTDKVQRLKLFKGLVKELPKVNRDTMKELYRHLNKVVEYKRENRMELQNVAIVFGPSLMWPEEEKGNVAVNLVFQGQVVEYILKEYRHFF